MSLQHHCPRASGSHAPNQSHDGSTRSCNTVPAPLCDIPSGCCFFTGPWTFTRSSLRMLRRVAAFCQPLRPVLLLVSFPRLRSPVVGVLGLCGLLRRSFDCFCCPHTCVLGPSTTCLTAFLRAPPFPIRWGSIVRESSTPERTCAFSGPHEPCTSPNDLRSHKACWCVNTLFCTYRSFWSASRACSS